MTPERRKLLITRMLMVVFMVLAAGWIWVIVSSTMHPPPEAGAPTK